MKNEEIPLIHTERHPERHAKAIAAKIYAKENPAGYAKGHAKGGSRASALYAQELRAIQCRRSLFSKHL